MHQFRNSFIYSEEITVDNATIQWMVVGMNWTYLTLPMVERSGLTTWNTGESVLTMIWSPYLKTFTFTLSLMFCSKNRALNLQEIKVFKKHCQSISWVFFLLYILNQGRRLNGAKYAFRFSVKLLHFYLSIANLSVSNGQFSLLLAFRPTIPNSWTKSVELLTNVQKERNHKLYNMKPQVLPGKSAHTRVRGGLRPKLCHG